jgi:hypothetical protein
MCVVELKRLEETELFEQRVRSPGMVEQHTEGEGEPLRFRLVARVERGRRLSEETDLASQVGEKLVALLWRPLHGPTLPGAREYHLAQWTAAAAVESQFVAAAPSLTRSISSGGSPRVAPRS